MADLSMSLRIQSLLQKELFDKIVLDPNEAKRYYEANPDRFVTPEQVRARHILIKVPQNATDQKRAEARKAIEKAAQRIKAGEPFEAVAKEVSQDGSASKGGDLGYFTRGRMVPEFEKAVFALEKGKVSEVVETRFGYHLIKVEDRRPPRTVSFEEAKQKIENYLYHQKQAEAVRGYIEGLRAQAVVEMKDF